MPMVYGNTTTYGQKIGILMLATHFPRVPGDIGNATSFPFPVAYRIVKEATAETVVNQQDPALIEPFCQAARELEAAVNSPVISSSLLQVRLVCSMLSPGKKVGIITAKAPALSEKHFAGVDITDVDKVVYGIEDTEFGQTFFTDCNYIDLNLAEAEMIKVGQKMLRENPDVGAIVLECTNMPPFTRALQEATGLPVFDVINLIRYVHDAIVSPGYKGYL